MSGHYSALDIYLTAHEAYPGLEQAFLEAEQTVVAAFRIFDPATRLHSKAALQVGETWGDLFAHIVGRGVKVTLRITDFDPIVGAKFHLRTHQNIAQFRARVGNDALLDAQAAMHPARISRAAQVLLWPKSYIELRRHAVWINDMDPVARENALAHMPALTQHLQILPEGRVRARLWPPARMVPATNHQKIAVIDAKVLYIGGLDLDNHRYDTPEHRQAGAETWHDVQLRVEGRVAQAAHDYLKAFAVRDQATLSRTTPGLLRTYSVPRKSGSLHLSPKTVLHEIETAHITAIKSARRLIYLENQFLRDPKVARALCAKAVASPDVSLIIMLPGAPEEVAFEKSSGSDTRFGEYLQAKAVKRVRAAFGDRVFIGAPVQPRRTDETGRARLYGAPLVYLHSKVSIFDDTTAIVSSANLNGRSLRWDTEAGLLLDRPADVAELRRRCFAQWLPSDADPRCFDPASAVAAWRELARDNAGRAPEDRRAFLLPFPLRRTTRFGRNLPGVPEEVV